VLALALNGNPDGSGARTRMAVLLGIRTKACLCQGRKGVENGGKPVVVLELLFLG
jgi:hypothetical protein